jgi:hypothetical protein
MTTPPIFKQTFDELLAGNITDTGRVIAHDMAREIIGPSRSPEHLFCERVWGRVYLQAKSFHRQLLRAKNLPPEMAVLRDMKPQDCAIQHWGMWLRAEEQGDVHVLKRMTDDQNDFVWCATMADELIKEGDIDRLTSDLTILKTFLK